MRLFNQFLILAFAVSLVACGGGGSSGGGTNNTTNQAPTANNLSITGNSTVTGDSLTGSYTYADIDGDPEGVSTYRWLRNGTAIAGAITTTYVLVDADGNQTITFEVTPEAKSGNLVGVPIVSNGLIVDATFSVAYCDGATINGNCTSSKVMVADFETVFCVDSLGDEVCPSTGELYFGQDGNYSINPESNTLETLNGNKMVETITGLSWAQTAYAADSLPLAIDQCNTLASSSYANLSDWRVPSIRELSRIVSKNSVGSWPTYMDTPQNSFWWSLTQAKNVSGMTFGMSGNWPWTIFQPTDGAGGNFSGARYVYCVSGSTMAGKWRVDFSGLTVTHTTTGLMWQRSPSVNQLNWDNGLQYCMGSAVGGFNDWRLPTLREHMSVLDYTTGINHMSEAFHGVINEKMLTSTPNSIGTTNTEIAYVNESTGTVRQENVTTLLGLARCVRGPL